MIAHTSVGAHTNPHKFGRTYEHTYRFWSTYEQSYEFWSTYERTYKRLNMHLFAPGAYMKFG